MDASLPIPALTHCSCIPGSPARNPFDNLPSTPAASPMHSPKHPPSSGAGRPSSTRRSARNGADSPFADVNSTPALPSTAVAAAPTAAFKSDSKHVPSALDSADVLRVPIMPNQSLVFGRKPDLSSIAPPTPQHTVHPVRVPNTFTHASRTHCICTLTAPPLGGLTMRITVMGTNGLMVDEERFEEGTSAGVELKRKQGEEVELGFYGNKRVVCEVKLEDMFGEGRATRGGPSASKGQDANPALASPRPKLRVDNKRKLKDDVAPSPPGSPASKKPRPSSIALEPTPAPSVPPLSPSILSLPPAERARSMVPHLNLDLPGLIAAAIVFNPRAMVKTDEVVRGVLEADPRMREALRLGTPTPTPSGPGVEKSSPGVEAQPASVGLGVSMMGEETKPDVSAVVDESSPGADVTVGLAEDEDEPRDERTERAVAAWRQVVLETLNEHDMFGCVTNEGLKVRSRSSLLCDPEMLTLDAARTLPVPPWRRCGTTNPKATRTANVGLPSRPPSRSSGRPN